jgi:phenylalanyl-tRNA synthetase beta chain
LNSRICAITTLSRSPPHFSIASISTPAEDGSGSPRQIVCGAKNFKAGDKVPLALPGAHLPNGLTIKKSKLRGVESEGMLCSPIEIALGDDGSGLLILSPEAPVGEPLSKLFPPDTIFDVEITPNRPDLLSHYGLAREIAALTDRSAKQPTLGALPAETRAGVRISAPNECAFYSLRRIDEVKVERSPDWLRARIEAAGVRPINNIVDISNYVMLELGQPTHAFDAAKVHGAVEVRLARTGEKFLALDGRTYSLGERELMIADGERAVAIAGVMGGEETGVSDGTTSVLLESAWFSPVGVRRMAQRLNMGSDASYRFERGVDPEMVLRASQRVTELIERIAGGKAAAEVVVAGKLPAPPADVLLRAERVQRALGVAIDQHKIDVTLTNFGLTKRDATKWKIPSYRRDLMREADLIEEIVRAFGVERLPSSTRSRFTATTAADREFNARGQLRRRWISIGLTEARTSVLRPRGSDGPVELRNPLNEENAALRASLWSGLCGALARNLCAGLTSVQLFEVGRVFTAPQAAEAEHAAIVMCGDAASALHWRGGASRKLDLFDVKGAVDLVGEFTWRRMAAPQFALAAEAWHGEEPAGMIGQLTAAHAAQLGADAPVVFAELKLQTFLADSKQAKHREMDRFPAVRRDIAMIVPAELPHAEILRVMESGNDPLLARVELFDVFAGESLGKGRKSVAYSLTYRDKNRTLTNDEVAAVHAKIRERLKSELDAELRE